MTHIQQTPHGDPRNARIVEEEHHITGPNGADEIEGIDDRGRRWYHPRPQPRRRTDFMGINSTWWMTAGWIILIVVLFFPFPWWW